jgi:hypothetical protein
MYADVKATPIDIPMKALLEKEDSSDGSKLLACNKIAIMVNRTFNPVLQKTKMQVLEESSLIGFDFNFFLCKGPSQFNALLNKYKMPLLEGKQQTIHTETFQTMIVDGSKTAQLI